MYLFIIGVIDLRCDLIFWLILAKTDSLLVTYPDITWVYESKGFQCWRVQNKKLMLTGNACTHPMPRLMVMCWAHAWTGSLQHAGGLFEITPERMLMLDSDHSNLPCLEAWIKHCNVCMYVYIQYRMICSDPKWLRNSESVWILWGHTMLGRRSRNVCWVQIHRHFNQVIDIKLLSWYWVHVSGQ